MEWMVFGTVTAILIVCSVYDIIYREVDNILILPIVAVAIMNATSFNLVWVLPSLFLLILGYFLWQKKAIGAADAKILGALGLVLPYHGLANAIIVTLVFIIQFSILAGLYGFIFRLKNKKRKHIPLVPIILIAYVIINLIGIH